MPGRFIFGIRYNVPMQALPTSTPCNILLVGMMGSGKTTVGKLLAKRLGKTFVDSDHEIQRRTGVSISTIFEIEGEEGFRRRESAVLEELARLDNLVLATGGGIVLAEANRRLLKENGTVVYLRATHDELWARTRHDRQRPLLQTENPRARLGELIAARDPLYREVADIIIDTSKQSVHTLVRQLENRLVKA
jgi:shikimate kinase